MSKKVYLIQPVELSTMEVEADYVNIEGNGVAFYIDGDEDFVFYAPDVNTKYITRKDYSSVVKKR